MISFRHFPALIFVVILIPSLLLADEIGELETLLKAEDYEEALSAAEEMSFQQSGKPDFDFLYGVSARKAGHPEVAVFALERVILQNPKDVFAIYERALALLEINDLRGAKFSLEKVLLLG